MVPFLLFLTGLCGLVYEVVWMRWFATVYGGTVPAGAAVLSSYLGGLALGSAWLGRRADRSLFPHRLFGLLQFGVGLLGVGSLAIPAILPGLYGKLAPGTEMPVVLGLIRFGLTALFLLFPAVLMGGALPVAVRWHQLDSESDGAYAAGWLRGANCLGATLGALLAAWLLIPTMGLGGAVLVAAPLNFLAAGIAMGFGGKGQRVEKQAKLPDVLSRPTKSRNRKRGRKSEESIRKLPVSAAILMAVFIGSLILCIEVIQIRAIAFFTCSTVFTFAGVTAVYLAGLGLGSAGGALVLRHAGRGRAAGALAVLLAAAGAGTGLSLWLMTAFGPGEDILFRAIVVCTPVALPLGAAFPLLVALIGGGRGLVGRAVGWTGAVLDLGSTAGPLLAALLILPVLGTCFALAVLGACAVLVAVALAFWAGRAGCRIHPALRTLVIVSLPAAVLPPVYTNLYANAVLDGIHRETKLRPRLESLDEGLEAVITVISIYQQEEDREVKFLFIGRRAQADTTMPWLRVEKVMGALPALLCPHGKGRSFHVGLGSGVTAAWSAAVAPGRKLECAELVPGVAARLGVFRPHNAVGDFALYLGDGRSRLATEPGRFEFILTDIVFPESAGAGGLFSVEYFRLARRKLADGGLFAHWLPVYQLSPGAFRAVVRSFLEVFPEASMWAASLNGNRPVFMLLGMKGSGKGVLDPAAIAERIKNAGINEGRLVEINLASTEAVLSHLVTGAEGLEELAGQGPLATDDHPIVEFHRRKPNEEPWAFQNLRQVLLSWRTFDEIGLLGRETLTKGTRERIARLRHARRLMGEAGIVGPRSGPGPGISKTEEAHNMSPGDAEITYDLWSRLVFTGEYLLEAHQMAAAKKFFADSLALAPGWRRAFVLRGLARATSALSTGSGGKVIDQKGMKEALCYAHEATERGPRQPQNWEMLAEIAGRLKLTDEAERAADRAAALRGQD